MQLPYSKSSSLVTLACLLAALGFTAAPVAAQDAKSAATPAAAPPAAAAPAAAAPAPVAAPAAEPAVAATSAAPEAQPVQPPEPPPPAQYAPLGGQPEAPIEKGDWNPWDHPAPGRYSHDGFFMRLTLGFGASALHGSKNDSLCTGGCSWSGPDFGMGLALGGSVVENLALYADLQRTTVIGPHQASPDNYGTRKTDTISMSSLGIGVTYYFMPVDIHIGGSVGVGTITMEDDTGRASDSSLGMVGQVLVGKEWWVGYDWGIGLTAQLLLLSAHNNLDGRVSSGSLNLLFNATYN